MNVIRCALAAILFSVVAFSFHRAVATVLKLRPLTVKQILADPDKYSKGDFIVKGYVQIRGLHKFFERSQTLIESQAIAHRMDENSLGEPQERIDKDLKLYDEDCINIWDTSPLIRAGKLINNRTVVLRAKLIKDDGDYAPVCGWPIVLSIEEVLDPAPGVHHSRHSKT
jgi:hypothetical protein